MSDPDWIGNAPEQPWWSDDGDSVYYRQKRSGEDFRDVYRVPSGGGGAELLSPAQLNRARQHPLQPIYLGTKWAEQTRWLSPDGQHLLLVLQSADHKDLHDQMPQYVNESGTVTTREVRERVGRAVHPNGLSKPLLIATGMQDDKVFFQESVLMVQRLLELKKEDFEIAIYPLDSHGFTGPESWLDEYRRIYKLMNRNLLVE
jgi:dipeptidyl aminopeptidase/acylaminoacyl peptidase